MTDKQRSLAFIGSYAEPDTPGVYACTFDTEKGQLTVIDQVDGLKDPTFLAIDDERDILYSIGTVADADGTRKAEAYSYRIAEDGKLQFLNKQATVAPTCHITLDHTRRCLIVSSYHGGMIGLCEVEEDGKIGPLREVHQHEGSSVHPNQKSPHPHSVFIDRNNRYAICCDLGIDQIIVYKLDADAYQLVEHSRTSVQPGSGPRHLAFHPNLPFVYVINELNATISVFSFDEKAGTLTLAETVSTLPDDFPADDNACADIHISRDGRFLYGSNRGHDSIVVFGIDQSNGKLQLVEHVPTGGRHPRNFALSPDNRFLIVANRDTNNIVTFERDAESGKLRPAGIELEVSRPVCIKFCNN